MDKLSLFSEPFAPTGNIAGEGFKNLLGRPALGLLSTVIRESIQNSVDAADGGTASILIRVRDLKDDEATFLTEHVLEIPDSPAPSLGLVQKAMANRPVRVLEICDFGTSGLGGPTRADLASDDEEPDFVNFMRNVGAPRDTHQGGGTYGYGKTSLYAMSSCATILVDTVTAYCRNRVRRVMGAHLGGAFVAPRARGTAQKRYTGRHWWGIPDNGGGIEPLEGEAASLVASKLGLPEREVGDTGTSIVIIDPQFEQENLGDVADDLVETILWNFWPRMTRSTPDQRRLHVRLDVAGETIPIPEPEEFPPLDLFADALAKIRNEDADVVSVVAQRPAAELGALVISKGATARRVGPATRPTSSFYHPSARIALMRPVELVVRYIEGEPFPDAQFEWAGVFRCSDVDVVEQAFAHAEPPAHEDWVPENLPKGREKTWVRVALRELNAKARSYAVPSSPQGRADSNGPSLAQAASRLGSLLGDVSSRGPGTQPSAKRKQGSRSETSISNPTVLRLEEKDGLIYAIFGAEMKNRGGKPEITLRAEPYLVADGGSAGFEDLPDELVPQVAWIQHQESGRKITGDHYLVGFQHGTFEIGVRMSAEAAVGLRLRLEEQA